MTILAQFLLRLAFGLAVGMGITSPRLVTSGYFRNHLFVTLGLTTLAVLVLASISPWAMGLAVCAAVLSYVGSMVWLYDARRVGVWLLWLVAACALAGALMIELESPKSVETASTTILAPEANSTSILPVSLRLASVVASGLVLGFTIAAMLLGHWYLNVPGMELAPLRRLLVAMALAVGLQVLVGMIGMVLELRLDVPRSSMWGMLLALRWFWLLGVIPLIVMAWRTLDIPNTQSATGILYVGVIGVFIGELAAMLLSAESTFPI